MEKLFFNRFCCSAGVHIHRVLHAKLIFCFCCRSVQRSNCYMVCGADAVGPSSASRSNSDLEIGCLIDLATGLVSFTANGKELSTTYQVNKNNSSVVVHRGLTYKDSQPHKRQCVCMSLFLPPVVNTQYFGLLFLKSQLHSHYIQRPRTFEL